MKTRIYSGLTSRQRRAVTSKLVDHGQYDRLVFAKVLQSGLNEQKESAT